MLFTEPSTPTKRAKRNLQAGQAIVLIALLILVLFGMLGLAIDSGRGYAHRRAQQTPADPAALAPIRIFGATTTVPLAATAAAIGGNPTTAPPLPTRSSRSCATQLAAAGQLAAWRDDSTYGAAGQDTRRVEAGVLRDAAVGAGG